MGKFVERGAILGTILMALSVFIAVLWKTHCTDEASGFGLLNLCVAIAVLCLKSFLVFVFRVLFDRICYFVYALACVALRIERKPYRDVYKPSARFTSALKKKSARVVKLVGNLPR